MGKNILIPQEIFLDIVKMVFFLDDLDPEHEAVIYRDKVASFVSKKLDSMVKRAEYAEKYINNE